MSPAPITTEQLVADLRHNPAVEMTATDHEGVTWQLSYREAEPGSDEGDTIEYTCGDLPEDEVDADAFISLHGQYLWAVEGVR